MRVDANDQLVVLANEPFKQITSQVGVNPFASYRFAAEAWVRVRSSNGLWADVANRAFELTAGPISRRPSYSRKYTLDAQTLAVAPNGDIWVGGAAATFKVSRELGWQRTGRSAAAPSDQIGLDGALADATFASANQLVADNAGITFYDGETCQIRRLTDTQIATVSGPRLGGVNFSAAGFLGQDNRGDLLLARGAPGTPGEYSVHGRFRTLLDLVNGRYETLAKLLRANLGTPNFKAEVVKSLAASLIPDADCTDEFNGFGSAISVCTGATTDPSASLGMWLGSGTAGVLARVDNNLISSTSGVLERVNSNLITGLESGAGTVISSTTTWPGILNGVAPSGPSGAHLDGSNFYLFGWMRSDVRGETVLRLYQLDIQSSAVTLVAGKSIASGVYAGVKVDLSPVIPSGGGGPAFVQHRSDGKFWLSNGKEIWLLDAAGQLQRIAGLSTSGAGADGAGANASFALISSIRVLPDNRLLVVDQNAHAIRLLGDDGKVSTIIGTLNTKGTSFGALPAALDTPVDAFAVGKDVYITTQTSRNLLRANGAL